MEYVFSKALRPLRQMAVPEYVTESVFIKVMNLTL